jgi:hypothetical protein
MKRASGPLSFGDPEAAARACGPALPRTAPDAARADQRLIGL